MTTLLQGILVGNATQDPLAAAIFNRKHDNKKAVEVVPSVEGRKAISKASGWKKPVRMLWLLDRSDAAFELSVLDQGTCKPTVELEVVRDTKPADRFRGVIICRLTTNGRKELSKALQKKKDAGKAYNSKRSLAATMLVLTPSGIPVELESKEVFEETVCRMRPWNRNEIVLRAQEAVRQGVTYADKLLATIQELVGKEGLRTQIAGGADPAAFDI